MLIYHLVPARYYANRRRQAEYFPKPFAQDGFIHCTKDPREMARVANRFYKTERGPHVYLYIDTKKVKPKIKYEDTAKKYPHIYGGLNRDAVVAVKPARREVDGTYLPPEPL
jgi:glutathione S-transferase